MMPRVLHAQRRRKRSLESPRKTTHAVGEPMVLINKKKKRMACRTESLPHEPWLQGKLTSVRHCNVLRCHTTTCYCSCSNILPRHIFIGWLLYTRNLSQFGEESLRSDLQNCSTLLKLEARDAQTHHACSNRTRGILANPLRAMRALHTYTSRHA